MPTSKYYLSTDASAPQIAYAYGSLVALLDACLVNGYGAKTALGWTIEYTATNKRVYRAPAGNRFYLRIDDSTPAPYAARARGYVSMSDIDTGTEPFPTDAQVSGGLYFVKNEGTPNRPWVLVGNDRFFWFTVGTSDTTWHTTMYVSGFAFGDFPSLKVGDAYNTIIIGALTSSYYGSGDAFLLVNQISSFYNTGHYCPRSYTQGGTSVQVGKHVDGCKSVYATNMGGNGSAYPNPIDNKLHLCPIWINDGVITRGYLPGVWNINHPRPLASYDTFSDAEGRQFMAFYTYNASVTGQLIVEISNTW